ncbi:iron complex transport system substrate-binding protein [Enterococcus sp. PF1-24]|uniref:siderophore ABC transporter substrate-binding protein n=1 Tax=unclassified Enterococcus TaxID=2608891 RepID=UPI0024749678|nr:MULTISPECIES: siderophore ABC transporter substrate-binding protein [unclassified Enterococcus]MDH6363826.1 iron complex transport system substrate-binding protein [Enterococcus sp. PFB1-1]MDH6400988.1 iron complex transport system substrate-binding protein [Enterococcus sp. PF1-24]
MNKLVKNLGLLLAVGALAGCSGGNTKDSETAVSTQASSSVAEVTAVTVTDSQGDSVEITKNPEKVVVFDNGSLDTLDVLGVGDSVVGAAVDNLPEYLAEYRDVESAGGIKEPDMEKINAMEPDLIIISGRQGDYKEELSAIAPTIFLGVDNADTWNSIENNVETLATIFDKTTEAEKALADLETKIADVKAQATESGEKALVTLVNEGELSAYGSGSRFGIVHDVFGFALADENIEASTHGQNVSYEYVLEMNPDILFVVDRTQAIGGDTTENQVADNELVKETNAGKNGKVYTLTPDVWYLSGGGLKSVELMINDVQQALK